jgi:sn-glycerol 3-phosphate transport system ATP-binding protein
MTSIDLKQIKKSYGNHPVVHGVDLHIADGEFIVIVGPSGCGKSTLLRMVAGLEAISSGDLFIGDQRVNHVEPKDRNIAMVFQNYALYPHMSVYDNMAYGLKIRGLAKADIEVRVQKAANVLELSPLLQRKPRELSGGQRQRVAMGRAIVREPAAFLFDEPLSNLDAKLRVQMRLEIKRLHRELKTTSIFVTHDQVEAMTLADRIVVMNGGRVEQVGTPMEIYERPQTPYVASFIGSPGMNLIDAQVVRVGDNLFAQTAGFKVPLPMAASEKGMKTEVTDTLTIGMRPEAIHLDAESPVANALHFQLFPQATEPLGADTLIYAGFKDSAANNIVIRAAGLHASIKGALPVWVNMKDITFFENGRRWL